MSNPKEYYGGFFWLAAVSMIVPLFVAYKAIDKVTPTSKPPINVDASGVDNAVWDYLLKNYVAGGLVDYNGIKKDYLFYEYIRQLGNANPDALPSDAHRLALSCNAYNAFVINGVITHKKPAKVNEFVIDDVDFFNLKEHIFAGKTVSLNEMEHKMIRPTFKDPRVHVALVCAARSCPALRPEAYTGERIEIQLQDQCAGFANNKNYVDFNSETGELQLSPILNWYGDDWNEKFTEGSYLQWIAGLVDSSDLKSKVEGAISGDIKSSFFKYDWALNSQSEPGASAGGGKSASFGSGTIPDE